MKKGILLLSATALAANAFAASQLEQVVAPASLLPQETMHTKADTKFDAPVSADFIATDCILTNARYGEIAATDEAEELATSYQRPAGLFYIGLAESLSYVQSPRIFGGPYTDLTWTSTSTGATSLKWIYTDPTFESESGFLTSTAKSLTLNYPYSKFYGPTLTATSSDNSSETYGPIVASGDSYTASSTLCDDYLYSIGGSTDITFSGSTEATTLGMCTYPRVYNSDFGRFLAYGYNTKADDTYISYYTNGTYTSWTSYMTSYLQYLTDDETATASNVSLTAFGNIFEKPNSPYMVSKVWAWFYYTATEATTINLTIYKVDDEGYITDDVIASGTATIAAGSGSTPLSFELKVLDEDGFETNDPILIDSACYMVIDGFTTNDKITQLYPIIGEGHTYAYGSSSPYTRHAINSISFTYGEKDYTFNMYSPWSYYTDSTYTTLLAVTDYMFMTDGVFGYCFTEGDDYSFEAPTAGGNKTFTVNSLYSLTYYSSTLPTDLPDWLTATAGTFDTSTGQQTITLTAAALPAGTTGRSFEYTINPLAAAPVTITVTQGQVDGISSAVADSETVGVEYFNLQGQKLAQEPANGLFIKKEIKSNGSIEATKVIK